MHGSTSTIRAVVMNGGFETHYFRAGQGRSVLLLGPVRDEVPGGARLFAGLSHGFRVIAPFLPGPAMGSGDGFSSWLRGVLDGLGLASPSVIALGEAGPRALSFAMSDPGRVHRLVLVLDPSHVASEPVEHPATHPFSVLRVRRRHGADLSTEQVARIVAYLAETVPATG